MRNYRPLRLRFSSSGRMQMRMVPLIDVVFLLLIFFLLGANFRSREGFLPTELPRQIVRAELVELEPLHIYLHSSPDGTCQIDIDSEVAVVIEPTARGGDFSLLSDKLLEVLAGQGRHLSDPVKLVPNSRTKWDHVVKAYDALWQINLRHIIFTMVD